MASGWVPNDNPHAGPAWWLTVDGQIELASSNGLARKPGAELIACATPVATKS
jgi:hypothetical protein